MRTRGLGRWERSGVATLAANLTGVALAVPVGVIVARGWGAEGRAVTDLIRLVTVIGLVVAGSGLGFASGIGGLRRRGEAAGMVTAAVAPGAVVAVVFLAAGALGAFGAIEGWVVALGALAVPAAAVVSQGGDALRVTGRHGTANALTVARSVAVVVSAGAVWALGGALMWFVAAWVLVWLIAAAFQVRVVSAGEAIVVPRARVGWVAVRDGWWLQAPNMVWPMMVLVSVAAIGARIGLVEAGVFAVAAALADVVTHVGIATRQVAVPERLAGRVPRGALGIAVAGSTVVALGLTGMGPWLVPWLYGSAFVDSVTVLWVLAAAGVAASAVMAAAARATGEGAHRRYGQAVGSVAVGGAGAVVVAAGVGLVAVAGVVAVTMLAAVGVGVFTTRRTSRVELTAAGGVGTVAS